MLPKHPLPLPLPSSLLPQLHRGERSPLITVIVLVGAPGVGKSTYAAALQRELTERGVVVSRVSADDHFVDAEGRYAFDVRKLGAAHEHCFAKFIAIVSRSLDETVKHHGAISYAVIVDNTNTTALEIAPYYLGGRAHAAKVEVVRLSGVSAEAAAARNVHGVPLAGVAASMERAEALVLPPFWELTETRIDVVELGAHVVTAAG